MCHNVTAEEKKEEGQEKEKEDQEQMQVSNSPIYQRVHGTLLCTAMIVDVYLVQMLGQTG